MFFRRLSLLPLAALLVLSLAGCKTVNALNANLETGKAAYKAGDYTTATAHYEALAAEGFPDAQTELAIALRREDAGAAHNPQRARMLLEQATQENYPRAFLELGDIYAEGDGVAKDPAKARDLYQKAVNLGYTRAYYQMGKISEDEGDYSAAESLYRQALKEDYFRAAQSIAGLYRDGKGRPADAGQALAWYYAARDHGVTGTEKNVAKLEQTLGSEKTAQALANSKGLIEDWTQNEQNKKDENSSVSPE